MSTPSWIAPSILSANFARLGGEVDAVIAAAGATTRLVSIAVEKVQVKAGRVVAHRLRERIRAEGPTSPRHVLQPLREGDHVSL